MRVDERAALYLHGRGDTPADLPGPAVREGLRPRSLIAPSLDEPWYEQRHAKRVEAVDHWMDGTGLAVGHSFGAWLLLCAATVRLEHGRDCPPLILFSTVLGRASSGGVHAIAPWSRRVGSALVGQTGASAALRRLVTFVHGERDAQCPVESVRQLASSYEVHILDSHHSLDDAVGQAAIFEVLSACCSTSSGSR